MKDNLGRTVKYQYDTNGNLQYVTDAKGGLTTYSVPFNSAVNSYQLIR